MGGEIIFFTKCSDRLRFLKTMGFVGMGGDTLKGLDKVELAENKTIYI